MRTVGLDIGTFHSVAAELFDKSHVISHPSLPSVAVESSTDGDKDHVWVGFDATQKLAYLKVGYRLLLAPKLEMGEVAVSGDAKRKARLVRILSGLAKGALARLAQSPARIALTVPPGWSRAQCDLLSDALASVSAAEQLFLHEPIALLLAGWWLGHAGHAGAFGRLDAHDQYLICDWGAGTVDLALVERKREANRVSSFQCRAEETDVTWGGHAIARKTLHTAVGAGDWQDGGNEHLLMLQRVWQGDVKDLLGFDRISGHASSVRKTAAHAIGSKLHKLLGAVRHPEKVLFLMYGGPLESDELREELVAMVKKAGVREAFHLGSGFVAEARVPDSEIRRDALVAVGASVFANCGTALPEFSYQVVLRDGNGLLISEHMLERNEYTEGKISITPPHTGLDYFFDIIQLREGVSTPTREKVGLFVREGAVVLCWLETAGVGFAKLRVAEARAGAVPRLLDDGRNREVLFPERSTRFRLEL